MNARGDCLPEPQSSLVATADRERILRAGKAKRKPHTGGTWRAFNAAPAQKTPRGAGATGELWGEDNPRITAHKN